MEKAYASSLAKPAPSLSWPISVAMEPFSFLPCFCNSRTVPSATLDPCSLTRSGKASSRSYHGWTKSWPNPMQAAVALQGAFIPNLWVVAQVPFTHPHCLSQQILTMTLRTHGLGRGSSESGIFSSQWIICSVLQILMKGPASLFIQVQKLRLRTLMTLTIHRG